MARAERRYDRYGPYVCMAAVKGYRMVRRPGKAPTVVTERAWQNLSPEPWTMAEIIAFDQAKAKREAQSRLLVNFLSTGQLPALRK